jgi:hypothetical protein
MTDKRPWLVEPGRRSASMVACGAAWGGRSSVVPALAMQSSGQNPDASHLPTSDSRLRPVEKTMIPPACSHGR